MDTTSFNILGQNPEIMEDAKHGVEFRSSTMETLQQELSTGLMIYFESFGLYGNNPDVSENLLTDIQKRLKSVYPDYYDSNNFSPTHLSRCEMHSGFLTIYDSSDVAYVYQLDQTGNLRYYEGTAIEVIESRRNVIRTYVKDFSEILDAMDTVFDQNEKFWSFDRLTDKDTYNNPASVYHGKTIFELQALAREAFHNMSSARRTLVGEDPIDVEMYPHEKRYADMIMGIGDLYEGGAQHFEKNNQEITYLLQRQVESFSSPDELLDFLIAQHERMYRNTHRSKSVNESYSIYASNLHQLIYGRLIKELITTEKTDPENTETAQAKLMSLSHILRGKENSNSILTDLKDPKLASQITLFLFHRPGGIMDKFSSQDELGPLITQDPEMNGKSPNEVVDHFIEGIQDHFGVSATHKQIAWELSRSFGIPFELFYEYDAKTKKHTKTKLGSYEKLSYKEKGFISLMQRLSDKIHEQERVGYRQKARYEYKYNNLTDLGEIFHEVYNDTQKDMRGLIGDNFEARWDDWNGLGSEDLGGITDTKGDPLFTDTELEIIDTFNDIEGNGLFDLSDVTEARLIEGGKIVVIIAAGVAIGFVTAGVGTALLSAAAGVTVAGAGATTGSVIALNAAGTALASNLIVQGAIVGAGTTMVSWLTHPVGHDSNLEMLTDLGSDVVFGTATGVLGGGIAKRFEQAGGAITSVQGSQTLARNMIIVQTPDLSLGIGAEMFVRAPAVDALFDAGEIIKDIGDASNHAMSISNSAELPTF